MLQFNFYKRVPDEVQCIFVEHVAFTFSCLFFIIGYVHSSIKCSADFNFRRGNIYQLTTNFCITIHAE